MIYTDSIRTALNIAYKAHKNQLDKGGVPYIYHPIHIAEQMDTEEEIITALLHDVVEDSSYTLDDLKLAGIKGNILNAIKLLTNNKNKPYEEYINAIKQNKLAKKIKIKDLEHNCDLTRIPNPSIKDYKRVEEYKKALEILIKESNNVI